MASRPAPGRVWQAVVEAPADRVGAVEAALAAGAMSFGDFEIPGSVQRRIEALYDAEPDGQALSRALGGLPVAVAPVADRDWVGYSQRGYRPLRVGRFYLHGSHDPPHPAGSLYDLTIDAGRAFGTGRHDSTRGCLVALDRLARGRWSLHRRVRRALDLGCGSGILAFAMARAWAVPVLAADIDPAAVAVTRRNARENRLAHLVRAVQADGFAATAIRRGGPYDLITANILARPLASLAPALAAALAPGGVTVLSGLLTHQEAMVRVAYRGQGLRLLSRTTLADWRTLILGR